MSNPNAHVSNRRLADLCLTRAAAGEPPFSFVYDGKPSRELLPRWESRRTEREGACGSRVHTVTYRDTETGIECEWEMTEYPAPDIIEWVVRFRQTGGADTPVIEDIQALDVAVFGQSRRPPFVSYSKGTDGMIDDFALTRVKVTQKPVLRLASRGSREIVPFFNLEGDGEGVIFAIGWTGHWACTLERPKSGGVIVRGGMAHAHLRLHPGESIRTPRILYMPWRGDKTAAHNRLRRHMVAHHLPRPGGREVEAPICNATWGGLKAHHHVKTIAFVREHQLLYDCYWVDAGWYGVDHETEEFQNFDTEDWAYHIGEWRVNRAVYPEGLKPVTEVVHESGMKFLLWFSPYTAVPGVTVVDEHPEWILREDRSPGWGKSMKPTTHYALDIGHPEARRFLLDQISRLIVEHRVDWFRDDGGLPLPDVGRDAPDRQGIGEIRCVEGFYEFWDELLRRHPDLLIDNCGGGGTRIDLETVGRSLVFHRTDYNCYPEADPVGMQVGTHGLSHWAPLTGGALPACPGDTYRFRSAWCGALPFSLFHACAYGSAPTGPAPDYPGEWHRKMAEDYRRVRAYYKGDFYPLTSCTASQKEWFAYQMDRPDLGEGVVVVLRRPQSPFETATFPLPALDGAKYDLTDLDTGRTTRMSGKRLRESGIRVNLSTQPGSKVMVYRNVLGRTGR